MFEVVLDDEVKEERRIEAYSNPLFGRVKVEIDWEFHEGRDEGKSCDSHA
jgi:hypothetical protein